MHPQEADASDYLSHAFVGSGKCSGFGRCSEGKGVNWRRRLEQGTVSRTCSKNALRCGAAEKCGTVWAVTRKWGHRSNACTAQISEVRTGCSGDSRVTIGGYVGGALGLEDQGKGTER